MSFEILATDDFERELKKLAKRYRSLKKDIAQLGADLREQPEMGTPIGKNCYKIRLAISAKGMGKSGGARVITCVYVEAEKVYLLSIYDKSEQADISEGRLRQLVESVKGSK